MTDLPARDRSSLAGLDEQQIAWELRGAWAARRRVVLTLAERCMVQRIEGVVERVSVTGAFAIVDGWHIPCADVTGIHKPHYSQEAQAA